MKELLLADAIGNIDDRLVEEYIVMKAERQKKRFSLKSVASKWALAAASFFLAIIIGTGVFLGIIMVSEEGVDLLQFYREGTLVKSSMDTVVTIYVSQGQKIEYVMVPDFVGKTEGEAMELLIESQLALGKTNYRKSQKPVGTILEQSLTPASSVVKGITSVDFVISGGPDYKE